MEKINNNFELIKKESDKFLMGNYLPFNIAYASGKGSTLTDTNGKKYVDFFSAIAVNSLGYNHPEIVKTIKRQAKKPLLTSNFFYNEHKASLAKALTDGNENKKVFFSNSGAEANECAIKLSRKFFHNQSIKRFKFISTLNSFHGRTLATVTATGQPKYNLPYAPLPNGFGDYIPFNDIPALEKALADGEVCALIIECLQGEGGLHTASQEYMTACRELTKKHGALLIIDEVQTGIGRTGKMFCYEHFNIEPDIVCVAKALGGGLPIGACIAKAEVASAFSVGDHGTTFGGSPFVCAVANTVVSTVKSNGFLESVISTGEHFKQRLREINSPLIEEVKGLGLMLGAKISDKIVAKDIVVSMLKKGFIINACGNNTLRFVPPLIITKKEIDSMVCALGEVLKMFID
ncbi:MAG: aspartate aminotransferase family protein [Firmicutes bacterium]|nr:aspartate aminotransferase family protein [Bacillota bacterium]